jgi:hypothetical protein
LRELVLPSLARGLKKSEFTSPSVPWPLASARGEGKGREIRIVDESATTSSDTGSKRRGSDRLATNLMETINLSFTITHAAITAVPLNF